MNRVREGNKRCFPKHRDNLTSSSLTPFWEAAKQGAPLSVSSRVSVKDQHRHARRLCLYLCRAVGAHVRWQLGELLSFQQPFLLWSDCALQQWSCSSQRSTTPAWPKEIWERLEAALTLVWVLIPDTLQLPGQALSVPHFFPFVARLFLNRSVSKCMGEECAFQVSLWAPRVL